jgi:RHS repeat-associated protein
METPFISPKVSKGNKFLALVPMPLVASLILITAGPLMAATGDYTDKLTHVRLSPERLLWVGPTPPSEAESEQLWNALGNGRFKTGDETVPGIEAFVRDNPSSVWVPCLQGILGEHYRQTGYFTLALHEWRASWDATKQMTDPKGRSVADYTLVNWLQLLASLGRTETMKELFDETQGRQIGWQYQALYRQSHQAYAFMLKHPEYSYRCGTYALDAVAQVLTGTNFFKQIWEQPSPQTGFSMAALMGFADSNHLNMAAVERPNGNELVVPSVMHWKENHYAAIVARKGDLYKVVDPTFRMSRWLTAEAINAGCSGQFLVPAKQVPDGWRHLTQSEAAHIFGKGFPSYWNPPPGPPPNPSPNPSPNPLCGGAGGAGGMPTWTVLEPWCDLWITDEPLAYQPATGPRISFGLYFSSDQYANGGFAASLGNFSVGANWTCSWYSYVVPPGTIGDSAVLYPPGGGERDYTNLDGTVPDFSTNTRMLQETNGDGSIRGYRLIYPSGAEDVYEYVFQEFYTLYFLSQQINAYGRTNTFVYTNDVSGSMFLHYVVDADGKTTTLSCTNFGGTCYITNVTDPYGRSITLNYDFDNDFNFCKLTNIVDESGISSSFNIDRSGNPTNLVTPYGTTSFYTVPDQLTIVKEPNGSHQMFFYSGDPPPPGNLLPTVYTDLSNVPTNRPVADTNMIDNPDWNTTNAPDQMDHANSFYWGRQQFDNLSTNFLSTSTNWNPSYLTSNDLAIARLRHWNRFSDDTQGNNLSMEREPSPDDGGTIAGKMTWYGYPGKPDFHTQGSSDYPSVVIKVLPDGSEQYVIYQVDQWGNRTNVITTFSINGTTLTRTNRYVYSTNGVDLLLAIGPDGVTNAAYGYNTNHQVLFMTNALREVASYTYNTNEQLATITQPNGLVATDIYGSNGYLTNQIVTGISTNSYTYINGLVYTHTDERGLTVTYSWDALERLTNVAYPDGTHISYLYSNLDLVQVVDRMGFTNSYGYNSIRQKISETDALGHITHYVYCDCGALYAITNALNQVTLFSRDNQGNLINIFYPDSYSVTNTYNSLRQLTQRADTSGAVLSYAYNNQGLETSVSNTVGRVAAYTFDIRDRLTNSVDANGVSVGMTYDNLNRLLTRIYPDNGVEKFGYTLDVSGPTSYTNQITNVVTYAYDTMNRKTKEVYVGVTTNNFTYDGSSDLLTLTDGKNQTTTWYNDIYGRVISKYDNDSHELFIYGYDADNRLTNRWSNAKGTTVYRYDTVANLTNVDYSGGTVSTPSIYLSYDALNRPLNMVDGVGNTAYSYDAAGQLLTEDGPWANDTVTYAYTNRLRMSLSLQAPSGSAWSQSYGYDTARRLISLSSPAGAFGYSYDPVKQQRVDEATLPNGAYITNTFDSVARLLSTGLENSSNPNLDSYAYGYNLAGQRANVTRTLGDFVNYTYDNAGELTTAIGKAAGGTTNRWQEQLGYAYDAAGNLNYRTNNGLLGAFSVNNLNELTTVTNGGRLTVAGTTTTPATSVTVNASNAVLYADATFASTNQPWTNGNNSYTAVGQDSYGRVSSNSVTVNLQATNNYTYDLNGNLLSDGTRNFAYDDENQLVGVSVANVWSNNFAYDGKMRRRIERDYSWTGAWTQTNEIHFIYDGNVVIQERNGNNNPLVTYTRGNDLSGTLQGAGGIGGLLARTDYGQEIPGSPTTAYYHSDGNGNVTMLIYTNQIIAAKYLYDPYGNTLSMSGPLASLNVYRFSSKEWNSSAGLYYYLYRFYDPNLQRWPSRDPIGELGGINLYEFVANNPISIYDSLGLCPPNIPFPIDPLWPFDDPTSPFYNPYMDPYNINNPYNIMNQSFPNNLNPSLSPLGPYNNSPNNIVNPALSLPSNNNQWPIVSLGETLYNEYNNATQYNPTPYSNLQISPNLSVSNPGLSVSFSKTNTSSGSVLSLGGGVRVNLSNGGRSVSGTLIYTFP